MSYKLNNKQNTNLSDRAHRQSGSVYDVYPGCGYRCLTTCPFPVCQHDTEVEEYRQVLIAQNAHQKNMAGYCREIGCGEDAEEYGY